MTGTVVIAKVLVLRPAGMTTLAGVVAAAMLSASVMVAPAAGAGPFSVTVPVTVPPPPMSDVLKVKEESAIG